jgi:hypothetical protein
MELTLMPWLAGWAHTEEKTARTTSAEVQQSMPNTSLARRLRYLYNELTTLHRIVRRHSRHPPPPQALRKKQHQSNLVHPRPLPRDLPRRMRHDPGRRSRNRSPRLQPRKPRRHDDYPTARRARQMFPLVNRFLRQASKRQCRPVVGDERGRSRAADELWH